MRSPRSRANEIGAQGDVHQQVRLLRHVNVENFEIRAAQGDVHQQVRLLRHVDVENFEIRRTGMLMTPK
jgi:hypothetical protein